MSDLQKRYESCVKKLNEVKSKRSRLEGQQFAILNSIRSYGYDSIEDAIIGNEKNKEEISSIEKQLSVELSKIETLLGIGG